MFGFLTESSYTVSERGLIDGIRSIFIHEAPYSSLDTNNWVIDYRLNFNHPGVNTFSKNEKPIQTPMPEFRTRILLFGNTVPYLDDPSFVTLLKENYTTQNNVEILNGTTPGYTTY